MTKTMHYPEMILFLGRIIDEITPPTGESFVMLPSQSEPKYTIWLLPIELVDRFKQSRLTI